MIIVSIIISLVIITVIITISIIIVVVFITILYFPPSRKLLPELRLKLRSLSLVYVLGIEPIACVRSDELLCAGPQNELHSPTYCYPAQETREFLEIM